jgi:hypothetical protein
MARLAKGEQRQTLTEDIIDDFYGDEPSGQPHARPEAPRITANYLPAGNIALNGSIASDNIPDFDYGPAYTVEYADSEAYCPPAS